MVGLGHKKIRSAETKQSCRICGERFNVRQSVMFTADYVLIHKGDCFRRYLASAVAYYNKDAIDIINNFGVSVRTAYRVLRYTRSYRGW